MIGRERVGGGLTQQRGGGQQFVVAGLLPAVLEWTGALAGLALEDDVLALLRGAVGVAPGLRRLHCGKGKQRVRRGRAPGGRESSRIQSGGWAELPTPNLPALRRQRPIFSTTGRRS